jgi:2-polyprenyl-3-methyl-5-hydroxy-6-metoxy-1,4-benzoquinol methylase
VIRGVRNYKNIPIRAAEGLHEACFDIVKRQYPDGARVLDIAAGAGAFSMRLRDAGYEVVGNDIDDENWPAADIPKLKIDLNEPLDYSLLIPPYDLIVAMEVIEHLQNPEKLLSDCKELVKEGGNILISTPNVLDQDSRFMFLRKGMFYHFSPQSYFDTGHQTVLPYWLLELLFSQSKLEIVERKFAGSRRVQLDIRNLRALSSYLITRALKPLMKTRFRGELEANCIIYLLQISR